MIVTSKNGLNYKLNKTDFTANVVSSPEARGFIYIPKYINQKYLVTNISQASFKNNKNIKIVNFSENSELITIDKDSFSNSSLEIISIPSRVIYIGESSFSFCNRLKRIYIPENSKLQSIGKMAFAYSSLESIIIPSEVEELQNRWCYNAYKLNHVSISPRNKFFIYLDQKIVVEKTSINYDNVIFARHDIISIQVPSFIKRIGSDSFSFCKKLQSLSFTDESQLISIESGAFYGSSITEITIPIHVVFIGGSAFYGCDKLKNVEFKKGSELCSLGREAFAFSSLNCINIPKKVNQISRNCFFECQKLKKIIFSENSELKTIEKDSFLHTSLEYIAIPQDVNKIEEYAFSKCENLKTVEFLGINLLIESCCFNKCKSLILASFPNSKQISIFTSSFRLTSSNFSLFIQSSGTILQKFDQCFFQLDFESQSD